MRGGGAPPWELGPALSAPAKKTVRSALKLLDRAVRDDPALRDEAALAATAALAHEGADVQGEVLDRLERWGVPSEALAGRLEGLAATQRPRAEALLGLARVSEDAAVDEPPLDAIPEPIRTALALEPFGPVPPAPVPGEPVLDDAAFLMPIQSLEELTDLLTRALLNPWEPNQDERLLDGILRACGNRDPFYGPLNQLIPRRCSRWEPG